jgi:dethiobiotin synthetase
MQVDRLAGFTLGVMAQGANLTLVEGAGGWRVPVNARETLADLAKVLNIPVILVVGVRLGCINHALLTVEAIARDGLTLAGWVANCIDPNMAMVEENLATLEQRIHAPLLGRVPYLANHEEAEGRVKAAQDYLNIDALIT